MEREQLQRAEKVGRCALFVGGQIERMMEIAMRLICGNALQGDSSFEEKQSYMMS